MEIFRKQQKTDILWQKSQTPTHHKWGEGSNRISIEFSALKIAAISRETWAHLFWKSGADKPIFPVLGRINRSSPIPRPISLISSPTHSTSHKHYFMVTFSVIENYSSYLFVCSDGSSLRHHVPHQTHIFLLFHSAQCKNVTSAMPDQYYM